MTNEELEKCEAILSKAGYLDGIETDPAKRIDSIFRISLNTALEHLRRITRDNAASPAGEADLIEALNAATNGEISTIPDAVREEISQKLKERRISFTLVNTSKLSDFKLCLNFMLSDDGSDYYEAAAIRQYIFTEEQLFDLRNPETGITLLEAAREAEKEKENYEPACIAKPNRHCFANNIFAAELRKNPESFFKAGGYDLQVTGQDKRFTEMITTHIEMKFNPADENIKYKGEALEAFDLAVANAVATIQYYTKRKHIVLSIAKIWTVMGGSKRPTSAQCDLIERSLEKMNSITTKIIATDEMVLMYHLPIEEYRESGSFLPNKIKMVKSGGRTARGVEIYDRPIIYWYCELNNHIATISQNMLTVDDTALTARSVVIMNYLAQQISIMRHDSTYSRKVYLNTLLENIGLKKCSAKVKRSIREFTETYLLTQKRRHKENTKTGIADYEVIKDSRTIIGFEVVLK